MAELRFNPQGKKTNVPIRHTVERYIEIHLDDGTILNFKPTITRVDRYVDQWDQENNPIYVIHNGPNVVGVQHVPGDMKRKGDK